jgi:glutamyl-tRNA reductase
MFLLPFHVVSCSHEHNDHDLIGRLRLTPEALERVLVALQAQGENVVLLSTCHRTELYWWGDSDLAGWFRDTLVARVRGGDQLLIDRADADLAVRHLFAVTAGMRSARFGEPEIAGQVRRAWQAAHDVGMATGPLDRLCRQAVDASRHIRAAMGTDADPSLGKRVRDCIARQVANASGERRGGRVLVVGAGDAARTVLEALRQEPVAGVLASVTSRTDERATALAHAFGVPCAPWASRDEAVAVADVVVFAVHVTSPMVGGVTQALALPRRANRALWIDLGVPGAIATGFAAPGIEVVTLDQLEDAAAPAIREARSRRAGVALQQELARCARETHRMQLGQRLGALEEQAVAFATAHGSEPADEVARRVARLVLRELTRA